MGSSATVSGPNGFFGALGQEAVKQGQLPASMGKGFQAPATNQPTVQPHQNYEPQRSTQYMAPSYQGNYNMNPMMMLASLFAGNAYGGYNYKDGGSVPDVKNEDIENAIKLAKELLEKE